MIYDSYGNIVTETNASNGDRFKYAGMRYNSVTGQYYDRARYYDVAIGRFMSQDPMGFAGGDIDVYRYIGNSPTNCTDPTGRCTLYGLYIIWYYTHEVVPTRDQLFQWYQTYLNRRRAHTS